MKLALILILGFCILVGAIVLNVVSSRFGLMNWYEFVKQPNNASPYSLIWLFIIYPFGLGFVAYIASKYLPW